MSPAKLRTVKAKPNYAIGKLGILAGGNWEGVKVVFMRIDGAALKTDDSYESDWIGTKQKEPQFLGDGSPIVGIHGRRYGGDDNPGVCSIGLYVVNAKRDGLKR